ncbi:urease accessory protein UreE [Sneathiella sp.]|uniref:urease accessory protein UreE n=1 Tax=Sneathiella sp. TaxID=1964365 RepID=UPI0035666631
MDRAIDIIAAGAAFEGRIRDVVTLDFDSRRRRRIKLTADQGMEFLLDMRELRTLRDGDIVLLQDGSGIQVRAKDEPVLDVTCQDTRQLVRIAWHLGNRHLPTELRDGVLRIRQDHVIEEMVEQLGATTSRLDAPFNPEGGAYGHGETQGHDHGDGSAHGHSHG